MTPLLIENDWSSVVARFGSAEALDASARASGALLRRRGVRDASSLLRLALAYGTGLSLREAATWAGLAGIANLSDVALLNRLRGAADWLGELAGKLVGARLAGAGRGSLRIVDGTMVKPPGPTGREWRLHALYDLGRQCFSAFSLTDRRGAETLERAPVIAGEIRVADRCFARPGGLAHMLAEEGDYVVRTGWKSLRLSDADGTLLDLPALLASQPEGASADLAVRVEHGSKRRFTPIACRLVILPKAPDAVERSRAKAKKASRRGGHRTDPRSIEAARFVLLLTSLPADEYPAERIGAIYRLRWQIELAFKRLKSIACFDQLQAKDERLARAWLYANLITALLLDDLRRGFPDSPP